MSTEHVPLDVFEQTPDEKKRYSFDYSAWVDGAETITAVSFETDNVTIPPIVMDGSSFTNTDVTFFVSGGKHNETYKVVCMVTTSVGQKQQDHIVVKVKDLTP